MEHRTAAAVRKKRQTRKEWSQMEGTLDALKQGEFGYISRLEGGGAMVQRLADLGFLPGTRVSCELVSPTGDPAAYRLRGALIALRRKDARKIALEPMPGAGGIS